MACILVQQMATQNLHKLNLESKSNFINDLKLFTESE